MRPTERPLTDTELDHLMIVLQTALDGEIELLRVLHAGVSAAETNKHLIDTLTGFQPLR